MRTYVLCQLPENAIFFTKSRRTDKSGLETLAKARAEGYNREGVATPLRPLTLMKKGTTSSNLTRGMRKNCLIHGLHHEWNILVGFKGESETV